MKEAFRNYFKDRDLTSEENQARLFEIYHVASRFLPGEIEDVFISQISDEKKGSTGFDNLWFFSKNHCLEAKEFLDRDDYEIHDLRGIQNLRVILENFDFLKLAPVGVTTHSTMIVEFNVPRGGRCQLNAYRSNCAKLADIALEYLKANLAGKLE